MADPDFTVIDGFDKYFQVDSKYWANSNTFPDLPWEKVFDGEWGGTPGNLLTAKAPIGTSSGYSLAFNDTLLKAFPASYIRAVGGIAMNLSGGYMNVILGQGGTSAICVQWNADGNVYLRRGNAVSTIIATGAGAPIPLAANSTHFISWDIEVKNTGGIGKVWVDGIQVINFSGDTTAIATDTYNSIMLVSNSSANRFDHFYNDCFTLGGGSELPFLTNPVVYTDNPVSDSAANFTMGATILGDEECFDWSTTSSGTTIVRLRRVLCNASGNLTDLYAMPWATSATAKLKMALYTDSAGSPGTLIAASNEVTGLTQYVAKQCPMAAPPAVVAGTYYWIAMKTDTSILFLTRTLSGAGGLQYTTTYAAAFVSPAASLSASAEIVCFGVIGSLTSRADTLDVLNFSTKYAYTYSATVGQEDLFNPPAIPGTPTAIHHVAVKALSYRSDAGARTVNFEIKSSATTSAGSAGAITPNSLTPNWMSSNFRKDPNGNIAWTKTNLDASKFGYKLVS